MLNKKGNNLQFGIDPARIDLMNEIDGIQFTDAEKKQLKANTET